MGFKLLGRTMFPALVSTTSPLTLLKVGLAYTFGLDVAALKTSLDPFYASGTFIQAGTGAITRTGQDKMRERVSVLDYGADPTYATDATSAIQNAITYALATGKTVYAPTGTYKIAGTLTVGGNGTTILGDGVNSTILKSPNAANAIISVGNGLAGIHLSGFQLNRAVTATSGGDGIQWALTGLSDGFLDNIWVRNCYVGFKLGPTALSFGFNLRAEQNISHGFLQTNNVTWGGNQWTMTNVYSGNNGGDGYTIRSDATAVAGMGTGNMTNVYTFANVGHGFSAIGTASSVINSVRLFQFFFGQDGASEIYLDTHANDHQIVSGFVELAGTSLTGPTNATAASGVGHGVEILSTNADVLVSNVISNGMSQSGFSANASAMVTFNNCFSNNNTNYGVVVQDGTKATWNGGYFTGNALGDKFVVTNAASFQVSGATPPTVNNMVAGALALGGATIGGSSLAVNGSAVFNSGWVAAGSNSVLGASATAFNVGLNGGTNPSFTVDNSTALQAAGLKVTGAATGGTVALAAIDSGTNTNLSFNAKGTGTVNIGNVSTGGVNLGGTNTNNSAAAGIVGEFLPSAGNGATGASSTVTITNASPGVISWTAHNQSIGSVINFTTTGGLPTGLSVGTNYYISSQGYGANSFSVSTTAANALAGTSINTSSAGSGTHTAIASAILTINTPVNIAAITLAAGDYEVQLHSQWSGGGSTTVINQYCSISLVSATIDTTPGRLATAIYNALGLYGLAGNPPTLSAGWARFSLAAPTTLFGVVQSSFATSTENAFGTFHVRRAR